MASRAEVERIIQYLIARYPGKFQVVKAGDFTTVDTWTDALSDVPPDALLMATRQYGAETHEWPPDAGMLRDRAMSLLRPALPTWADAWDEVTRTIRLTGHLGQPTFSHPLIEQTIQGMGGWQLLCQMEISETATWRAQFRDVYQTYAARAETERRMLPLTHEFAQRHGALPMPVSRQALPAPTATVIAGIEDDQPIRYAQYIRDYRGRAREKREAEGRRKAAQWMSENGYTETGEA